MRLLQPIVDRVESYIRNARYKEGDYFAFLNLEDKVGIKLLKGEFVGVVFSISRLVITEDLGYKGVRAGYMIEVHESPYPKVNNDLPLPEKLGKIAGDILLITLEYAQKNQKVATRNEVDSLNDEQDRESYSEEPVLERTVREESAAVPEVGVPTRKKRKNPVRRDSELRS